MYILDKFTLLSQPLLTLLSPAPAADICDLLQTLPEPLRSLEGECILLSDCTGYASPGFCRGASDIQVSLLFHTFYNVYPRS